MKLKKYLWKYLLKHGTRLEENERHCSVCGSCQYYDYSYESQLQGKIAWVQKVLHEHIGYEKQLEIQPSPKRTHYRNKMDFVATKGMIGMRKGGFSNVYDVHISCIFDERVDTYLSTLRNFKTYPDYDLVTHEGTIRYFVVRKHEFEGASHCYLSVVLNNPPAQFGPDFKTFLQAESFWDFFDGIYLVEQSSLTDLSYGNIIATLKGDYLRHDLIVDGETYTYTFGPQSFFQANAAMFEQILSYMRKIVGERRYTSIYDIYGGIGTIGIVLHDFGTQLVNVEISPENTAYFEKNAIANGVTAFTSITKSTAEYLQDAIFDSDSLVILDPPRIGMEKKAAELFISKDILPKTILYMSCNPNTQAIDLEFLTKRYDITEIKVFDMFPYTSHVESVAVLERRGN